MTELPVSSRVSSLSAESSRVSSIEAASPAFARVPVTPLNHFRLHFLAGVYRILDHVRQRQGGDRRSFSTLLERFPVLNDYLQDTLGCLPRGLAWQDGSRWWASQIEGWEAAATIHLPLAALRRDADLAADAISAFMIAGTIEEDARFGTLFRDLQVPLEDRRATGELVGRIARLDPNDDPWQVCGRLLRCGLLEVLNPGAPRSERLVGVPELLWDAARGQPDATTTGWCRRRALTDLALPGTARVPEALRPQIRQLVPLLRSKDVGGVVVRGSRGSDRILIAELLARRLDRGMLHASSEAMGGNAVRLGPLATLTGCVPVIEYRVDPGATVTVPPLVCYGGPVIHVLDRYGGLSGGDADRVVSIEVPALNYDERASVWHEVLGRKEPSSSLAAIAEQFILPGGHIQKVATVAEAHARLEGREDIEAGDVRVACRGLNHQLLDRLAERLAAKGQWSHLIVSPTASGRLRELQQRCRHRERLLERLGPAFEASSNRGVRALFTGPSGTGKTLAAKVLANELGIDLYRVDLASIIDKYVGETEKNLHEVLGVAEELNVVLLLDEGDALLGGRTEVRSANDRYANVETNYLLQRLEHYQGIVLVTTNLGDNIDRAFQRRMDVVVEFLPPEAEQRLAIWRIHLAEDHQVDARFLERVASRCALTGGQIRNAAMLAAMLALDEEATLSERHLDAGIRGEYRKGGGTCPLPRSASTTDGRGGGIEAFLSWD